MKKFNFYFLVLAIIAFAQCNKSGGHKKETHKDSNGYSYETVTNDPLNARIYTLANGLKVYLTVNKNEPRMQTCIAVKAGSSYDPAETTGLAHYLEHMMFKGSDEIGTTDWAKEEALLKEISDLYELHKNTADDNAKKQIYKKIDSTSAIAATYAIANEYDKLLSSIGGANTNAYTSNEETVYINDISTNQFENWLKIEKERFGKLVLRLFHTELETVYEEFNMSQDNDARKVNYALMGNLFPNHPYGTQTTLGKAEHLKNPSMVNIHKYWSTYYVPNNMAMCISGDIDFDSTIKLIDQYFGTFEKKDVPAISYPESPKITENVVKEVVGPDAERISIAYRFNGIKSEDYAYVNLINYMLDNQTAGLLNLNLVQPQKVQYAYSYPNFLKQYGMHIFLAGLRSGQSFEEVRDLIINEIDKIKKGEFEDWLLEAAIKNLRLELIRRHETNERAFDFVESFVNDIEWADYISFIDNLEKIKKDQLIKFANDNYKNYVAIYKKNGSDTVAIKIDKPELTPVKLNREDKSAFFQEMEKNQVKNLEPVWLDFKSLIAEENIKDGLILDYVKNQTNTIFDLYYVYDIGKNHDKQLALAVEYLEYLGSEKYTPAKIKQEFYKLGVTMLVGTNEEDSYVAMSGLDESLEQAVKLLEHLLTSAKADKESYDKFVEKILKNRADTKLNKNLIMHKAMFSFAKYGKKSPYTHIISEAELKALDPNVLTAKLKEFVTYKHRAMYHGAKELSKVKKILTENHVTEATLKELPAKNNYTRTEFTENKVYLVDYDMVQTWLMMITKDEIFNVKNLPEARLFGEYFGSGLSSIVFQEIRESRALAYSSYSVFTVPNRIDEYHYNYSFISTQADKLVEATDAMLSLLNNMPKAEIQFNAAKTAILQNYQTSRIIKTDILWSYLNHINRKLETDSRKDIYEKVKDMNMEQLDAFFAKHIKDKKYTFMVLGDKDLVNLKDLEKFGKVEILTLDDIFSY